MVSIAVEAGEAINKRVALAVTLMLGLRTLPALVAYSFFSNFDHGAVRIMFCELSVEESENVLKGCSAQEKALFP